MSIPGILAAINVRDVDAETFRAVICACNYYDPHTLACDIGISRVAEDAEMQPDHVIRLIDGFRRPWISIWVSRPIGGEPRVHMEISSSILHETLAS